MKKYLAEFIGTAVLVLLGCGTAATVGCDMANGSGYLITALAFGLAIVAMAYSIGKVSGCHVNPAVSVAMLISNKMSAKDCIGYIVAQMLGATGGAALVYMIAGKDSGMGANALASGGVMTSLIVEIVLTFIFVLAILGVTAKAEDSKVAGLVIGLTLTLVHLLGIAYTGTSVNPARSFGPALFAGKEALGCLWVFIVGPIVGAAIAAVVWKMLFTEE